MSGPFRPDNIPEPRWLRFGPDDPNEPPDNYMPDESRKSLAYMVEVLESTIEEVKGSYDSIDTTSADEPEALTKAWEAWVTMTKQLVYEVDSFRDDTVGDDWNSRD